MWVKTFFSLIFIIFAVGLLILYWFVPFRTIDFGVKSNNFNFSLNHSEMQDMQFYSNMRYPNSEISYKIYDCPLQKKDDMKRAFEIVSNLSVLDFYSITQNEEISVTCDSKNKIEEGLFIAGEGGPTKIINAGNLNVILQGKVLLIRDSKCERPNIALHELLHTLGFNHSDNPNNIMYYLSKCKQTIGSDIIELINELYSIPSYSDLVLENVSAIMHGRYLDVNMTVRNNGLKDSEETNIMIYADEKLIKEVDLDVLEIGHGRIIILRNVWVTKINVDELEFFIDYNLKELEKNNNKIILEIKNKK